MMMKTTRKLLFTASVAFLSLLMACSDDDEASNSVVSFSNATLTITTDDLSPATVSMSISPAAASNSTISVIVTGGTYGETFTTDLALAAGQIDIPVAQGATNAQFTIIPNEEGIRFDDINLEFEIISVGAGLSTEEFDGRFLDFTIENNKEQGTGLPYIESFNNCGPDGNGEAVQDGWEQIVIEENSFGTGSFNCYTGQGVVGLMANAYSGDAEYEDPDYTEVWYISPVIGLIDEVNPTLNFDVDRRFDAPIDDNTLAYGIQISTDYDGTNFETANWEVFQAGVTSMTANDPEADDIASTGDLDLSAYAGETISIAFIYRARNARFGATALRIANVVVE
ncbi:hypothetical protein C9994_01565 [Marivirga lumbricoides]|uniref:DUF5017 domain-containing protein n=1 Tax=Marivirga lumbricoides TaxID=1046115 RepID=A0A2T4DV26_9BACT|nr:hypothetical protein C9994_01565 [Marivirga lumbricoides]